MRKKEAGEKAAEEESDLTRIFIQVPLDVRLLLRTEANRRFRQTGARWTPGSIIAEIVRQALGNAPKERAALLS